MVNAITARDQAMRWVAKWVESDNQLSSPSVGSNVASLPPAFGVWRIGGTGERSAAVLSHQIARPCLCDSTSSGCAAMYSRMNLVSSDSYITVSLWEPRGGFPARCSWPPGG